MPKNANGEKLTIEQIAQALGISKTTVSRALSGKGRIGEETRARVFSYINSSGFSSESTMLAAGQKTSNLALIAPPGFMHTDLPFLRRAMCGVCHMAAQRNYDVLLCYADQSDMTHLLRQLENRKMDGVILSGTRTSDPCLDLIRQYGIPVVAMGKVADQSVLQVDNEQIEAAEAMTTLLYRMQMHRIAFICGGTDVMVNGSRLTGYIRAMKKLNVPLESGLIHTEISREEQLMDVLEKVMEEKPDCILCGDDSYAMDSLKLLRQRGIEVPRQVRLASMYDSDILQETVPSITATQFDAEALGVEACRMLLDTLAGKPVQSKVLPGYQLVLRDSTK